jgi:hypothetical protein
VVEDQQTSPDEVMKALKRYLKESTETEHAVAVLIGVNHLSATEPNTALWRRSWKLGFTSFSNQWPVLSFLFSSARKRANHPWDDPLKEFGVLYAAERWDGAFVETVLHRPDQREIVRDDCVNLAECDFGNFCSIEWRISSDRSTPILGQKSVATP